MNERISTQVDCSSARGRLPLWVAIAVWAVWVILPSAMLSPLAAASSRLKLIVAAQVGSTAVPYLSAAPLPLVMYLLASYLLALPVLLLLALHCRRANKNPVVSMNQYAVGIGLFVLMYLIGATIIVVAVLARRTPPTLALNWGPRLAIYGLITLLPQVGWVFGVALASVRPWRSVCLCVFGALLCAVVSPVLIAKGVHFPTPLVLRAEFLSGRVEYLSSAALGLLVWSVVPVLLGSIVQRANWMRFRAVVKE